MRSDSTRRSVIVWGAFGFLCGITSLEWLIPPAVTGITPLQRLGTAYAGAGVCAAVFAIAKGSRNKSVAILWRILPASMMFLGVPAILLDSLEGMTSSATTSLLFTATPVVVVLVSSVRELEGESTFQRLLVPALVGLSGALCVLPVDLPSSVQEWVGLAVALISVTMAGFAGVWLHDQVRVVSVPEGIAVVCFWNGLLLLGWCAVRGLLVWKLTVPDQGIELAFTGLQVTLVLLLLYLVREMEPVRLSARYLLVPLLTVGEGFVAMRPQLSVRLMVGFGLLCVGAWSLLRPGRVESGRLLSLR